ncbi:MAG: HEAT repeat domain-containing protein [Longimicrobiales bacterium]
MPPASEFLNVMLDSVLKSTVILALAAGGALWLRRGSAASRHLAWQLGLIGILGLPVVSSFVPKFDVLPALPFALSTRQSGTTPTPNHRDATSKLTSAPSASAEASGSITPPAATTSSAASPASPTSESVRTPAASPGLGRRVLPWLVIVWGAGTAIVLGRFGIGLLVATWYTRRARPLDAVAWASLNETMSFAVGLGHPVRLLKSERAATPMTFGVLNPIVLLPKDADEWPEERRRIVLLHELAHVHRLDSLTHIFANLACALYWFNPLVWITAGRLRAEAERACDDWVLRAGMRASTYADHLLDMVRTIGRLHTPAVALPMAQRNTFEGRLLAILEPGINRSGLTRSQGVLLTGMVALVVFPLAALAPAAADTKGNDDIPIGITQTHDTSKATKSETRNGSNDASLNGQNTQQTQTPRRGFLGELATQLAETILGKDTKPGQAATKAIKEADIDKVAQDALRNARVGDQVEDALRGKSSADEQQQPRRASDVLIAALATALTDDDVVVRREAVQALGQQEDPRAVAALSRALREDTDAQVRKSAAWALGQIEDARAVPALSEALRRDRDVEVRRTAVWALGEIESANAIDALFDAMNDADREVRAQSVWALGQIQDARAVPALTAAMRDTDLEIRRQAVWALGQIEDRAAVPALTQLLRDADAQVRRQAIWALGQIEDASAVPALTQALRDTDAEVRHQAVWALGQIETQEAVEPLVSMLNDASVEIRHQVVWALGQIQSSSAVGPLSRALREDRDAGVRQQAAWALGQIEDEAAVPALAAALKDASPEVRRQAAWALGQIESRPAPRQLLEALSDQDVQVRRQAIWAIGQIEDPNAVTALRGAMRDTDTYVKLGALRALTAIGDDAAFETLADMLKDPDPAVRRTAAQALGRGGMRWQEPQPQPQPQPRPRPQPRPQPRPNGW